MSYQERNIYASIISTLVIAVLYAFKLSDMQHTGLLNGPDAASIVGKNLIYLIVAFVVANAVVKMMFTIIASVRTKDCEAPRPDERDKAIELKGMQIAYAIFGAGFIATIAALAMAWISLAIAVNLITFSIIVGEMLGNVLKAFQYRRGY